VTSGAAGSTKTAGLFGAGGWRGDLVAEKSSKPNGRVFHWRGRERTRTKEDAEAADYQRADGGSGRKACMTGAIQIAPRTDSSSA
jgi:hypothetical protein